MKGSKKFALIGVAAVVALSLLGFGLGTTVFAQDGQDNGGQRTDNATAFERFVSKVADKSGLEYDVVYNAMQEAREEMMYEALQERLQEAVNEGLISQEQADQILEWMQNRPEALDQLSGFGVPGGILGGGRMMSGRYHCGW